MWKLLNSNIVLYGKWMGLSTTNVNIGTFGLGGATGFASAALSFCILLIFFSMACNIIVTLIILIIKQSQCPRMNFTGNKKKEGMNKCFLKDIELFNQSLKSINAAPITLRFFKKSNWRCPASDLIDFRLESNQGLSFVANTNIVAIINITAPFLF